MNQYSRTYAPPDVEAIPYPAAIAEPVDPPTKERETQAALIVTVIANGAMAAIIITAMLLHDGQAIQAILAGAVYFLTSTIAFAFIITGSLTSIVNHRLSQHTERRRIDAYQELGSMTLEWRMLQETTLGDRKGLVEGVHRLSPINDRFVTPYANSEDAAAREGLAWCSLLFDKNGWLDATKVNADGRLKIRMCGSKRGRGSRDAGIWLLKHGVIRKVAGGYALNFREFPTRDSLKRLLGD